MPAKASMLCMLQFNGYFGCPHFFMRGVSHQNRMLYPCNAPFVLRNNRKFEEFGNLAEIKRSSVLGIKKKSPLCNVFKFPWDGFLQLGIAPEGLLSLFEELERELEKRREALLSLRNALWEMKGYLNVCELFNFKLLVRFKFLYKINRIF